MAGSELKKSDLPHKAVLWPATGGTDDYGKPAVAGRQEIDSRWEWGERTSPQALQNTERIVATVYIDQYIAPHSLLRQGKLADVPANNIDKLVKVLEYGEVPDLKGLVATRFVIVSEYGGPIPAG